MGNIRLFVSHAEEDADIALALVRIVEAAMEVPENTILCTSAPGYGLAIGADVAEHLRKHLTQASCVVAVLTPHSLSSKWCLFELGGAWARATHTYPLLAGGLTQDDLPAALAGRLGGQLGDSKSLRQLVGDLMRRLGWPVRSAAKAEQPIDDLVMIVRNRESSADDVDEELTADFVAKWHFIGDTQQEILNYIVRRARGKEHLAYDELKHAFPGHSDLYYRLMQLRYLKFLKRRPLARSPGDVPRYGWTLSPEYAAKVWR
jgi:hypothetical protein